ncbi:hypothetical protein [uncultured Thiothrix sp.]|nr:hypothetical protein [uncultured Thiothrix sp.]
MFENMTSRVDLGDASLELAVMLGVAFILGFLFCYLQNKSND